MFSGKLSLLDKEITKFLISASSRSSGGTMQSEIRQRSGNWLEIPPLHPENVFLWSLAACLVLLSCWMIGCPVSFDAFVWIWAQNAAHCLYIHPAASVSSEIIDKCQRASSFGSNTSPSHEWTTNMFERWGGALGQKLFPLFSIFSLFHHVTWGGFSLQTSFSVSSWF